MNSIRYSLFVGIFLLQPVLGEEVDLIVSISSDSSDPSASELLIEVHNLGANEIWNVDVRPDFGHLGVCPAVLQLGRIHSGTTKRFRSTCIDLNTAAAELLIWRIDFDTDTGHRQILKIGIDGLTSDAGGQ